MDGVRAFLREHNLEKYAEKFEEEEYDSVEMIQNLDDEGFKAMAAAVGLKAGGAEKLRQALHLNKKTGGGAGGGGGGGGYAAPAPAGGGSGERTFHVSFSREDSELLSQVLHKVQEKGYKMSGLMTNQGAKWFDTWHQGLSAGNGVVVFFTSGNSVNQGIGYREKVLSRCKKEKDNAALYMEARAIIEMKKLRGDAFNIYVVDGDKYTPEQLFFNLDAPEFGPVSKWMKFVDTLTDVCENIPLDVVAEYPFNEMINLEFPGLKCVHRGKHTGSPIFEVKNFLTTRECEALRAKMSFVGFANLKGSTFDNSNLDVLERSSVDVRVARAETVGIHRKLEQLTRRSMDQMESCKLVRYAKGGKFTAHADIDVGKGEGCELLEGFSEYPQNMNREVTIFMYLNTVLEGGETVFFKTEGGYTPDYSRKLAKEGFAECEDVVHKVMPEVGKAVVFFPTMQPKPGAVPPPRDDPKRCVWYYHDCIYSEDTFHAGNVVIDPKELCAVWAWPKGVRAPRKNRDGQATDGVVIGGEARP